jgi:hypothetical protein
MPPNWNPESFLQDNFCEISIAARMTDKPYLCLVENHSGWEGSFFGLLKEAGHVSIPGFAAFYGDETVGQIAAVRVRSNEALHQQILKPCDPDESKVLILYLREAEARITCVDLHVSGSSLN